MKKMKFGIMIYLIFHAVILIYPEVCFSTQTTQSSWRGLGTIEDPFQIENATDLVTLSAMVNEGEYFEGKYFKQVNNIDLSHVTWIPIGQFGTEHSFKGIYDGNGHYVENITINPVNEISNIGFFGQLGGTVMNFGIESGTIKGACVGSISSHSASSDALIINCYSKAHVIGARAGGIADNFNGTILNCWTNCVLETNEGGRTGSITSYKASCIKNCFSYPDNASNEYSIQKLNNGIFESCSLFNLEYETLNVWELDSNNNITLSEEKMSIHSLNWIDYILGNWIYWVMLILSVITLLLLFRLFTFSNRPESAIH